LYDSLASINVSDFIDVSENPSDFTNTSEPSFSIFRFSSLDGKFTTIGCFILDILPILKILL
jgi:hypothetical protein